MCFETMVYPVVVAYARKVFADDERQAISLVMAWWYWTNRKEDFPPVVWARCGVRAAMAGRDLPGLQSKFRDVWDNLTKWSGAGMQDVMERRPGPLKQAEDREQFERFMQKLNPLQRELVNAALTDKSGQEIAERIERSPARVSQIRQLLKDLWNAE